MNLSSPLSLVKFIFLYSCSTDVKSRSGANLAWYCSERFINKRFQKWDSCSRCQALKQKHWELSLEIKDSEYISVFPLIFQFLLNVPYSCKSANILAPVAYKEAISTAVSFFSSLSLITLLMTDILSVITYQNICVFIKWKHIKYHAERSKYPFHPGEEMFSFQPEVKGTCVLKKSHPGVNFTSPTCNISVTLPLLSIHSLMLLQLQFLIVP